MITSQLRHFASLVSAQSCAYPRAVERLGPAAPIEFLLTVESGDEGSPSSALQYLVRRMYGGEEESCRAEVSRLCSLCDRFLELYGDGPVRVLRAPARINIIGEHVDYVSYLPTASLPFGSREHDMLMLYRPSENGTVCGASTLQDYEPFSFSLREGPSTVADELTYESWMTYLFGRPVPTPHWGNYVKGAVYFARIKYGRRVSRGLKFLVDSNIPAGGGASSSSALVVLASAAAREANGVTYEAGELAVDAAQAEWYVGTRGGAMDHTTICIARSQYAVLINYGDQQSSLVSVPGGRFRWVTFFSHPADKGREVMVEYNERSAVSRVIIPAVIEGWKLEAPERYDSWRGAVAALQSGSSDAVERLEEMLRTLPLTLSITGVGLSYPEAFAACSRAFPILVKDGERPLKVRARALHHVGEVRRVSEARRALDAAGLPGGQERVDAAMRSLGELLNESHASLRELYDVSTSEVESLVDIIRSDRQVYGARLMGGGFGGNVLALTTRDHVQALTRRVQREYYAPRGRDAQREGSVMISTPGEGLSEVNPEAVWRDAVVQFNALGRGAQAYRTRVAAMLDAGPLSTPDDEVWPLVVAAGNGTRARATGLGVPKTVAPVAGLPSIARVIMNLRAALPRGRPPVVIISPETEQDVRRSLKDEEVTFVVQPEALGTGDAVLRAEETLGGFRGRALVTWGTQPVIRPETIRRAVKLAVLFDEYEMVLPTVHAEGPYAPVLRDERGCVRAAHETRFEETTPTGFGETNIGLFLLKSDAMFKALHDLKRSFWREEEQRYERPGGELGFPNELINYLSARENGVFASPFADSREAQGIKELADIARCEQFISELGREKS